MQLRFVLVLALLASLSVVDGGFGKVFKKITRPVQKVVRVVTKPVEKVVKVVAKPVEQVVKVVPKVVKEVAKPVQQVAKAVSPVLNNPIVRVVGAFTPAAPYILGAGAAAGAISNPKQLGKALISAAPLIGNVAPALAPIAKVVTTVNKAKEVVHTVKNIKENGVGVTIARLAATGIPGVLGDSAVLNDAKPLLNAVEKAAKAYTVIESAKQNGLSGTLQTLIGDHLTPLIKDTPAAAQLQPALTTVNQILTGVKTVEQIKKGHVNVAEAFSLVMNDNIVPLIKGTQNEAEVVKVLNGVNQAVNVVDTLAHVKENGLENTVRNVMAQHLQPVLADTQVGEKLKPVIENIDRVFKTMDAVKTMKEQGIPNTLKTIIEGQLKPIIAGTASEAELTPLLERVVNVVNVVDFAERMKDKENLNGLMKELLESGFSKVPVNEDAFFKSLSSLLEETPIPGILGEAVNKEALKPFLTVVENGAKAYSTIQKVKENGIPDTIRTLLNNNIAPLVKGTPAEAQLADVFKGLQHAVTAADTLQQIKDKSTPEAIRMILEKNLTPLVAGTPKEQEIKKVINAVKQAVGITETLSLVKTIGVESAIESIIVNNLKSVFTDTEMAEKLAPAFEAIENAFKTKEELKDVSGDKVLAMIQEKLQIIYTNNLAPVLVGTPAEAQSKAIFDQISSTLKVLKEIEHLKDLKSVGNFVKNVYQNAITKGEFDENTMVSTLAHLIGVTN